MIPNGSHQTTSSLMMIIITDKGHTSDRVTHTKTVREANEVKKRDFKLLKAGVSRLMRHLNSYLLLLILLSFC